MERFAAIDFETANGKRSSICSIGIAILEDDWVVDSIYTLVRPTPNFYTRWTTAIHGLTAEDTNDALCFEEAWESIAPKLKDLPDMGPEGLNEFSRYFYPQLDKEGLIIDDRANGGGNVSPMILERLSREPYRLTMRRGSSLIGTVPDAVQVGPKVCLINKYSASDGDLFPWGFRALGLGKLIGTRTWGGIIGISGPLPYMDGTDIRVPFFTSYDPKTGNWIIENHGVDPDILIDNDPIKEWNGEDQQLDRAIEEVMKQLKERKPLAPVPAPRDWSHK